MRKKTGWVLFAAWLIFSTINSGQAEEKPILAVLPLETRDLRVDDALTITEFLQQELFLTGRYKLIERTKINETLEKYHSQKPGPCDFGCAIHIGKEISADKVILGSVGKLGNVYTIQVKMLDVNTEEIEGMSSIRVRTRLGDLPNTMGNLVIRLMIPLKVIEPKIEKLPEEVVKKTLSLTEFKAGKIRIKVQPYADVLIDDQLVGEVPPIRILDVPEGSHTVEFVSTRLNKKYSMKIEVKLGECKEIRMNMKTGESIIMELKSMD